MKKKNILFNVMGIILFFIFPLSVGAIGQITKPIEIEEAIRGEEVEQLVLIMNTNDNEIIFNLDVTGDMAEWTDFFESTESEEPFEGISIPANTNLSILARFKIPEDIPNGTYQGLINITEEPKEADPEATSTAQVSLKISRAVSIMVSDQENIELSINLIPDKFNYNLGENIKARVIYHNEGNIMLSPQLRVQIGQGNDIFYDLIHPYPEGESPVRSLSKYEIPQLEIPLNNLQKGKYFLKTIALHKAEPINEKTFIFSVDMEEEKIEENNKFSLSDLNSNLLLVIMISFLLMVGVTVMVKRR